MTGVGQMNVFMSVCVCGCGCLCAEGVVHTSILINRELLEAFEHAFLFLCTRQFQISTPPVKSPLCACTRLTFHSFFHSLAILSSCLYINYKYAEKIWDDMRSHHGSHNYVKVIMV